MSDRYRFCVCMLWGVEWGVLKNKKEEGRCLGGLGNF